MDKGFGGLPFRSVLCILVGMLNKFRLIWLVLLLLGVATGCGIFKKSGKKNKSKKSKQEQVQNAKNAKKSKPKETIVYTEKPKEAPKSNPHQEKIKLVTETAKSFIGTSYKFGGCDRNGIDCSGLVFLSLRKD